MQLFSLWTQSSTVIQDKMINLSQHPPMILYVLLIHTFIGFVCLAALISLSTMFIVRHFHWKQRKSIKPQLQCYFDSYIFSSQSLQLCQSHTKYESLVWVWFDIRICRDVEKHFQNYSWGNINTNLAISVQFYNLYV